MKYKIFYFSIKGEFNFMKKVSFGGIDVRGYEIISFISRKQQTAIAKVKKDNKYYLFSLVCYNRVKGWRLVSHNPYKYCYD